MKTDIEIARENGILPIKDIANKIGIKDEDLEFYGKYKAKISQEFLNRIKDNKEGKLVLVTAINPTPAGEGKTTTTIGLGQALWKLNKKSIIALREPSLGPCFGVKGGATGGGYSQVVPMEDINLHFTGDFHAITSANNLICSAIDNHIYFGNKLKIKEVLFNRCLDVNDRALRSVDLGTRKDTFNITSASEVMALFCLAKDLDDLRRRLENIIIGINDNDEYIYVKDLNIVGALVALLKDAFKPNLVQTLENTPTIIHGGPFANIAHGCNSVVATNTALSYADYVITEAGFGADLGAEKFLDIKCRVDDLKPDVVVLVATIKALKYHGGVSKEKIFEKNDDALIRGFANLDKHYNNLKKYGVNVVVCLNKFDTDTPLEIELLKKHCSNNEYIFSISTAYVDGGEGAIDLANKVSNLKCENFEYLYDINSSVEDKVNVICKEVYGASKVNFTDDAVSEIEVIKKNNLTKLPICIAKTQYSFSDDKNMVGVPKDFEVTVKHVKIYGGAEFITVLLGDIMTMPGLSRRPNYELIDVVDDKIINLS